MQNWMLRDIYMETFEVVAKLVDHPYTNVRLKVWGSLITWDTTVSSAKLGPKCPNSMTGSKSGCSTKVGPEFCQIRAYIP